MFTAFPHQICNTLCQLCVVVVSISTRGVEYGVQEGGGRGNLVEEKKGERDKVRVCVCV